ncbi:MAG: zinc ribbon domain-containing protein [Clostridia bacterium]|nr:zinc ribbon domain-containing protein [Clostridia bacterium]MDO4356197.1 zinc ribbon domain-containing protein [Clostridia bacterium]
MKYCKNCGKEIDGKAVICPHCGVPQSDSSQSSVDSGSFGYGILGFCIPIVGLILWLVWKRDRPQSAKVAGTGALISVIIGIVFYFIVAAAGIGVGLF